MNSFTLKISGQAEISEPLEMRKEYTIQLKGEIIAITKRDEQNGDLTYIHTLKPLISEILASGKVLKVIPKGTSSQKWRNIIGAVKGFDFYDSFMQKMIANSEQVIEFIDKL